MPTILSKHFYEEEEEELDYDENIYEEQYFNYPNQYGPLTQELEKLCQYFMENQGITRNDFYELLPLVYTYFD